ncbi:bifunctional methylenetetrahydrofolate dehydrogenase/methenyltetrahydrofolate cyclohydrolase FolD [Pseudohaliea sp.]|uniref:bifunctional methylenetetrahydrofolate dehydrogenase/methenyltetrahydrofolate cyclohydrolase FolD n=1 Tax=Pseudohaliea sp. TaxID=2740289 RepID=UPI0032EC69CD
MNLIDGKLIADSLCSDLTRRLQDCGYSPETAPRLSVILVGEDPASQVYVRNKQKRAEQVGFRSEVKRFRESISEQDLLTEIAALNADPDVSGILVQLPLPEHIDETRVLDLIDPAKDVDGFHEVNAGRLMIGDSRGLVPCTPRGCMRLITEAASEPIAGCHAVVIGRSNIVGKPVAMLLLRESCTVTLAHSRTRNLPELVRQADIVVAAVGVPGLVKGDWIKPGAIVIDVGINRISRGDKAVLVGDVDFDEAAAVAGAITPVPGGVGPMTIACLLENTLIAAQAARPQGSYGVSTGQ